MDEHVEAVDAGHGLGEGARVGELDGPGAGTGEVGGDGPERVGVAAAEQEVVGGRQDRAMAAPMPREAPVTSARGRASGAVTARP